MAKEHLVEHYGDDPLHDRRRLLRRLARAAAGGQRLPRHLPGHPAACSFPDAWSTGQQLVDYHLDSAPISRTRRSGARASPGRRTQIAAVEGHPNHVNAIVLDSLYWTTLGDPDRRCAGRHRRRALQCADQSGRRALHAGGLHDQRLGPAASVWTAEKAVGHGFAGCRSTTSAWSTASRRFSRASSRPAQFVDLNEKIGGARHRHQSDSRRAARPTSRRSPTPTAAA